MQVLVVLHKIGEIETDGNDLHIRLVPHFFLCLKGDTEDAFPEVPEPAFVAVVPFGHNAELVFTVKYANGNVEDLLVFPKLIHAVTDTKYREDLEGVE